MSVFQVPPAIEHEGNAGSQEPLSKFQPPSPTKEPLDWASLIELDLSKFAQGPEERKDLAGKLLESLHTTGFLLIVNHGVTDNLVQRHLDIANTLLNTSRSEKLAHEIPQNGSADGRYSGFAPQSYRSSTIYENNVEHYNFSRFNSEVGDEQSRQFPPTLTPYIEEVEVISKYIHKVLARKLFILIAIALEVDEHTFSNMHTYEARSDSFMRYMQYTPRVPEENSSSQDLYLPGHADWGSLTFLFNQPISALQIRDQDDHWRWVRYVPGSIVVNVGIALSALTGGYLKPTIHRVVKPPRDQAQYTRVSLLYFIRPYDTHSLEMIPSPVLEKAGCESTLSLTMGEYARKGKTGAFRVNYDDDKPGAQTRMFKK